MWAIMKSTEEIMLEGERDSFKEAARVAKEHNTQLVFWEEGEIVKRHPNEKDLRGDSIEPIKIP